MTAGSPSFVAQSVALLAVFRSALRTEARSDPRLPDRLDEAVFAYWEHLHRRGRRRQTRVGSPSPTAWASRPSEGGLSRANRGA